MKKLLVGILAAFMCLGCFTGCDFINDLMGGSDASEVESVESVDESKAEEDNDESKAEEDNDESKAEENNSESDVEENNSESDVEENNSESNVEEDSSNNDSTNEDPVYDLDGAKKYVRSLYKNKDLEVSEDYKVLNAFTINDVNYTITWSVTLPEGVTSGVSVEISGNESTINVDEMLAADLEYVLTATIADPAGNTIEVSFNRKVKALTQEVYAPIEEAPVEGVSYKFYVYQGANEKELYINGAMKNTYYFDTTENPDEGLDLAVETVDGGFTLYYMNGDVKTYINVVKSGTHTNAKYHTEADMAAGKDGATSPTVYTFSEELGTIVTTLSDGTYYLGCDGTYNTVEPQYKTGSTYYVGYLVCMMNRTEVSDSFKITDEESKLTLPSLHYVASGTIESLATSGVSYPDVAIAWEVEGEGIALEGNTITLTAGEEISTVTVKATLTCGEETATKEFVITLIPNTEAAILEAAYGLTEGQEFGSKVTLTGVVTKIDTPFDPDFKNVSVTMDVNGTLIACYRLTGDPTKVQEVAPGYTITVEGIIMLYRTGNTPQFGAGSYLVESVYGDPPAAPEVPIGAAVISFADKATRTEYSTEIQVWEQNGIKVTNNKASSTTNVGDYANPARFYKNSEVVIECAGMTKIVFDCSGFDVKYLNGIANSIADGSTVTVENSIITVELAAPVDSWTFTCSAGQGRANSITVYTA